MDLESENWLVSDLVRGGEDEEDARELVEAHRLDVLREAIQIQRAAEQVIYQRIAETTEPHVVDQVKYAVSRVIAAIDPNSPADDTGT